MFENIIKQNTVVSLLQDEIKNNVLPQAMLFYGNEYCGKLSCALELARVLSCEKINAAWNCDCPSCRQTRFLDNTNIILMGSRYFTLEIAAASDAFLRAPKTASCFLLLRSVRKLIKRFDTVLWEPELSRINKAQNLISDLEENLLTLDPYSLPADLSSLKETVNSVIKLAGDLSAFCPQNNIPIQQVRNIAYWSRISSTQNRKIVIIENVHFMLDGSSNALLKILEEPPPNVFFILITTKRSALLKTLLSRLRPYHFRQRESGEEQEVLEKIFGESLKEYKRLKDYFLAWQNINPSGLKNTARNFVEYLADSQSQSVNILEVINKELGREMDKDFVKKFLAEVTVLLSEKLRLSGSADFLLLEKWKRIMNENIYRLDTLNLNPKLIIESIYYNMRIAV